MQQHPDHGADVVEGVQGGGCPIAMRGLGEAEDPEVTMPAPNSISDRAAVSLHGDTEMNDDQLAELFNRMSKQILGLIAKTNDSLAHRATAVALLHHKVPGVSWTGFYFLRGEDLVVETYQGPVACLVLERHMGVCWAGIDRNETLLVDDVESFPGHIACDSRSRSEVVVPVRDRKGRPIGVLDVDSHIVGHFTEAHRAGYENIVRLLEERWSG
jgi:L-methionine (R)-S-oxide reductase